MSDWCGCLRRSATSDIFPTGYFGAKLAEATKGDTVAVFGCGPVGQFAIVGARLLSASRILAIDGRQDRLDTARKQGAEVIDFEHEDPVRAIIDLTNRIGVDRAIDAVGFDAVHAHSGPASEKAKTEEERHRQEVKHVAPEARPKGDLWCPGDAPSQVLEWAVAALAKAGTRSIIGVYPETVKTFPIGEAMNKNLSVNMGNCNHRKYLPALVDLVRGGIVDPSEVLTRTAAIANALDAYESFDRRAPGWLKVKLEPSKSQRAA